MPIVLLMFICFFAFIAGIVLLFFDNLRKYGIWVMIICIICFSLGFKSCKKFLTFSYGPSKEELLQQELEYEKTRNNWTYHANVKSQKSGDQLIQREINEIKNKLGGDSLQLFDKTTLELKKSISLFEKNLIVDLNSRSKINLNYPFQGFDFGKFLRFKFQKNWSNNIKYVVPIGEELVHVSGVVSNDSSCIVYSGYINLLSKIIYWTGFEPQELLIRNWNDYDYDIPSKLLELKKSTKSKRVELIYWMTQNKWSFYTNQVAFRSDQQKNSVLFNGRFIPFYQINQIKENGEIILRNRYKF